MIRSFAMIAVACFLAGANVPALACFFGPKATPRTLTLEDEELLALLPAELIDTYSELELLEDGAPVIEWPDATSDQGKSVAASADQLADENDTP
jgi:hypothetical protein